MVEIRLPRLAERKEDLPLLERHFIERLSAEYGKPIRGIAPRVQILLARYSWPGNVRELENVFAHACMMCEGDIIDMPDLPEYLTARGSRQNRRRRLLPMAEVHKRHALRVLPRCTATRPKPRAFSGCTGPPCTA